MKILSDKLITRLLASVLAASLMATVFISPLYVSAEDGEEVEISQDAGSEDIAPLVISTYKEDKLTVSNKALKNAKANVKILYNKKALKKKGLTVKAKKGKKSVNIVYVPAKDLAKAFGAKYKVKKGYVSISTGSWKVTFSPKADGYSYVTEIKGACGATGPISYGKPYQKNNELYVPVSVFENLYGNPKYTSFKLKKNVLTIKHTKKATKKSTK